MTTITWLIIYLSNAPPVQGPVNLDLGPELSCTSTMFGTPGDKWVGGKALYLKRRVNSTDLGIAHRTLPGNSKVLLENPLNGKRVIVKVIDRGPYGALVDEETLATSEIEGVPETCTLRPGGKCWYVKKRASWPGRWRGCVDITPAAAKALGHKGKQKIIYRRIKSGTKRVARR